MSDSNDDKPLNELAGDDLDAVWGGKGFAEWASGGASWGKGVDFALSAVPFVGTANGVFDLAESSYEAYQHGGVSGVLTSPDVWGAAAGLAVGGAVGHAIGELAGKEAGLAVDMAADHLGGALGSVAQVGTNAAVSAIEGGDQHASDGQQGDAHASDGQQGDQHASDGQQMGPEGDAHASDGQQMGPEGDAHASDGQQSDPGQHADPNTGDFNTSNDTPGYDGGYNVADNSGYSGGDYGGGDYGGGMDGGDGGGGDA